MDTEQQTQIATANHVKVLETNVLHASDIIYWLDGASAEELQDMQRVDVSLAVLPSVAPRDARLVNRHGCTAILRKPTLDIVAGVASEADRQRPTLPLYNFAGEVWDRQRRYQPARFDLNLGAGNGASVVLLPTPAQALSRARGCIFGRLLQDSDQAPLIYALLQLVVTIPGGQPQTYRAQTDRHGDFIVALNRLPPLPDNVDHYDALMTVTANIASSAAVAPDTSTYIDFELQSSTAASFNTDFNLSVEPGNKQRVNSLNKDYLAAQSV